MPIVYKHTNHVNGKAYIGWTSLTIEERWKNHLDAVKHGSMTLFHRALRKHGSDQWRHEVLEVLQTNEEAKIAEVRLITEHKTYAFDHESIGYNMTRGGDGTGGLKFTDEARQHMRYPKPWRRGAKHPLYGKPAHNRGKTSSEETKLKLSIARRGKHLTQNHKQAISECMSGEKNPMFGKKRNPIWGAKGWETRRQNKRRREVGQCVLYVCGPDRCGKTNIVQAVSNITGIKSFKATSEHDAFLGTQKSFIDELRDADPRVLDLLSQTCMSVIFDRGYPCEWVYAQFFGRDTDHAMLKHIDAEHAKLGTKILICTRKSFVGIQDDLDQRLDERALAKISALYEEFSKWTKCKTYTLFVDDEDIEREVNEVLTFMEKR